MADGTEIGVSRYDEMVYDLAGIDRLPALRGDQWFKTVREMTEQDATVGAVIFAVEMACRAVKWSAEPADESDEAKDWSDFLDQAFDDMPDSWADVAANALSFVVYGYSLFELVYKQRLGQSDDRTTTSKYDDGRIGWRKWAFRPQPSKLRWEYDKGDVVGWTQRLKNYSEVTIPAEKYVLFRSSARAGNAEGPSILKRAYRSYYHKRETEIQEAIGIMRDLGGLIHVEVPESVMTGQAPKEIQARNMYKKLIQHVHRGVQEGIMTPSTRDDKGNKLVEVKLLNSGGSRQFDTTKIIERLRTDIAMTMLADFVLIGHQQVGAYSVAASKVDTFTRAISGWLDMMEEAINEQAVARLMRMNAVPTRLWPKWKHGDVAGVDLKEMGEFISKMLAAGAIPATKSLAIWLAKNTGTPVPTDEELAAAGIGEVPDPTTDPTSEPVPPVEPNADPVEPSPAGATA